MKRKVSVFYILFMFVFAFGMFLIPVKKTAFAESFTTESKSSILIEEKTGTIIKSKNETEKLPIASMCKIMTLLVTFENIDAGNLGFDEDIPISENAAGMGGSQVFLERGANYKVKDLIKSIVVASANDSCVALAERICGSEDDFVAKMNQRAMELNMGNTFFTNCTGLPKIGQFSCALDVSVMFRELLKHKDYYAFSRIWMDEIEHPAGRKTEISNTNKLIRFYEGCDAGKTGYTSEAGHCLCASAMRNGMRLISVVISAPDSKTRFKEVSEMFNYGFAKYTQKLVIDDRSPLDFKVKVAGGRTDEIAVKAERPSFIFSERDKKIVYETKFTKNEDIKAPLKVGDKVGNIEIYVEGKLIDTINILSLENVEKKTYADHLNDIIKDWAVI